MTLEAGIPTSEGTVKAYPLLYVFMGPSPEEGPELQHGRMPGAREWARQMPLLYLCPASATFD